MKTRTRRWLLQSFLSVAACLALLGCGQKGPLYLPDSSEDEDKKKKEKSSALGRSRSPRA